MAVAPAGGDGSSPLARGLPAEFSEVEGHDRIIPARAGFTPRRSRWAPDSADHPRSRGVYFQTFTVRDVVAGSSPLARGLRG